MSSLKWRIEYDILFHNHSWRNEYEKVCRHFNKRGKRIFKQNRFQGYPRVLKIGMRKIDRVKKRFIEEGLDITLNGKKGSRIYAKKADGDFEAHLIALSCSEPPSGFARWSLRLLADKVVELDYIDSISHETIRQVLKKTKLNLGAKKVG